MKRINPSSRIKCRYLLIKANSSECVEDALLEAIGTLGWARAQVVFVTPRKSLTAGNIIISINRKALDEVRAAFALSPVNIQVLKVSGTLKGLGVA